MDEVHQLTTNHRILETNNLSYKAKNINKHLDDLIDLNTRLEKLIKEETSSDQGKTINAIHDTITENGGKHKEELGAMKGDIENYVKTFETQIEQMNKQSITLYYTNHPSA
ncbi:hypothetical protein [Pseudalkalibacillus decolorationis]|uniref:hypothetical protein n=1 Tax=Pseudalkalibacillus decolorationis TaxID=163879 RepID=UPI002147AC80|nr:hypothetical protein [Pseudalkalibacillus decolorationis]